MWRLSTRWPVSRLIVWKRNFSFYVAAGIIATGQVTSESFKYPFQNVRGDMF